MNKHIGVKMTWFRISFSLKMIPFLKGDPYFWSIPFCEFYYPEKREKIKFKKENKGLAEM